MTMSVKEKLESEEIEWSPEDEIQLFLALDGLKPVGINKYFFMACISDRLSRALNREVSTEAIWSHLKTLYNLEALDEMEPLPFPNETREFALPSEFSNLISKKKSDEVVESNSLSSGLSRGDSNNSASANHSLSVGNSSSSATTANPKSNSAIKSGNPPTSSSGNQSGVNLALSSQASNSSTSSGSSLGAGTSNLNSTNNGLSQKSTNSQPQTNSTGSSTKERDEKDRKTPSSSSSASSSFLNKSSTSEAPKRLPPKRTRGSMSLEYSTSPSTTPPPIATSTKRRRI